MVRLPKYLLLNSVMKLRKIYLSLVVAALPFGVAAQQRLGLDTLVGRLVEVNYAVQLSAVSVEVAKNNITAAPFLPTLAATARQNQELGTKPANTLGAGLNLSWRLFDGGAMFHRYNRTKTELTGAELTAYGTLEQLTGDLVAQYNYIVALAKRVEVGEQTVRVSRERYATALAKYDLKSMSGLEMRLAKTDLNADSSSLISMRQTLDAAYIELNGLLNFDRTRRGYVHDTIKMEALPPYDLLRELCMTQNTQILRAQNGIRLSELDLRTARAARYPTLDFASGFAGAWASGVPAREWSTGVSGTWGFTMGATLFNGMEVTRKIKNAKLEQHRAELSSESVTNDVVTAFHDQYLRYTNNLQLIDLENENSEAMELNLSVAMDRYRLGDLSGIDFRNIQLQYLSARERQITTIYQTKASEVGLLELSGSLL